MISTFMYFYRTTKMLDYWKPRGVLERAWIAAKWTLFPLVYR